MLILQRKISLQDVADKVRYQATVCNEHFVLRVWLLQVGRLKSAMRLIERAGVGTDRQVKLCTHAHGCNVKNDDACDVSGNKS
jgi:hypothetical protein